jgi:hypothetical protein
MRDAVARMVSDRSGMTGWKEKRMTAIRRLGRGVQREEKGPGSRLDIRRDPALLLLLRLARRAEQTDGYWWAQRGARNARSDETKDDDVVSGVCVRGEGRRWVGWN